MNDITELVYNEHRAEEAAALWNKGRIHWSVDDTVGVCCVMLLGVCVVLARMGWLG